MVALGMAGFVLGFALGLRFTVFVLLPIEVAALSAAFLTTVLGHSDWSAALLGFAAFSVSCQIAYALSLSVPVLWRARLP